jgi:uncharacterized protein HemY
MTNIITRKVAMVSMTILASIMALVLVAMGVSVGVTMATHTSYVPLPNMWGNDLGEMPWWVGIWASVVTLIIVFAVWGMIRTFVEEWKRHNNK